MTATDLAYGDQLTVTYEKARSGGHWTITGDVMDVHPGEHVTEIDIRDTNSYDKYTIIVSERTGSVYVRTNYPNPDDNQILGTNAEIEVSER